MSQLKRAFQYSKHTYQDILCAILVEEIEVKDMSMTEKITYLQEYYRDDQLEEFILECDKCEEEDTLSSGSIIWLKDRTSWLQVDLDFDYDARYWTYYEYPTIPKECYANNN